MMTLDRFIEELATSGRTWKLLRAYPLDPQRRIRIRTPEGRCPVSALATDKGIRCGFSSFMGPGHELGLDRNVVCEIAWAADHHDPNNPLRQRLLKACNLAPINVEMPTPQPEPLTVGV